MFIFLQLESMTISDSFPDRFWKDFGDDFDLKFEACGRRIAENRRSAKMLEYIVPANKNRCSQVAKNMKNCHLEAEIFEVFSTTVWNSVLNSILALFSDHLASIWTPREVRGRFF